MLACVAALTPARVIGLNDRMPWHLPNDLAHFKRLTLDRPVIMGHHTYLSIGRPLPRRRNLVLSRQADLEIPGCEVWHDYRQVLRLAENEPEVMIIGGEQIYRLFLPYCRRLYLTLVHADLRGDRFFPEYSPEHWREVRRAFQAADERNSHAHSFLTLERIGPCLGATE